MNLGCILLASGFATRFGGDKLRQRVEEKSLYTRALEAFPEELFTRRAVTCRDRALLEEAARAGWTALYNPEAEEGISAGIRLGLSVMEGTDGVLFAVCDQPWLTRRSVTGLTQRFRADPARIVALSWNGRRGNPVFFPRDLLPELAALTGDTGGSAVIRRHPDRLDLVQALSKRELRDIDTPEDLTKEVK